MRVHKSRLTILMIVVLSVVAVITVILYNNDSFKQSLGIDTRKEVKYDGSVDFSYEKGAKCEDIRMDYLPRRRSYVNNQVTCWGKEDTSFDEMRELLKKYDGVIVGYKAKINRYQVEFLQSTIEELKSKVRRLNNEELVEKYSADLNTDFIFETIKSKYSKDKRVEISYTNGIEFDYTPRDNIVIEKINLESGQAIEFEYMANLIRFYIDEKYTLNDVKKMANKYGGVLVGCLPNMHYYEVEFLGCDYEELQQKIELINRESIMEGNKAYIKEPNEVTTCDIK